MKKDLTARNIVTFGVFEVDLEAGELRKNGLKVRLQEQPFQVLAMLLESPGRVVTREELRQQLWRTDTFVDFEQGLNKAVNKLREALGDSADNPRFVETLPRRGYRFIAPVDGDAGKVTGQEVLPSPPPQTTLASLFRWKMSLPLWALLPAVVMIGAVLWALWPSSEPESAPPIRFSVEVPSGESLVTTRGASAVISPDGTRLAFAVGSGAQKRMYVRPLDQLQATEISGTGDVHSPFFSPDGEWIGFFGNGKLKKVSVRGGATVILSDVATAYGGSWSEDGAIIFAPTPESGLLRVSSAGGKTEVVTTLDEEKGETSHRWPQLLPGGEAVLFTVIARSTGEPYIEVQSLETGERKTVQQGGIYGRYLPTGHLVYVSEGTLFAAPFDLGRLEITGPPAPIVEDVWTSRGILGAQFDFSQTGTLVYAPGGESGDEVSIFWMDSKGKTEPLLNTPGDYYGPRFSPDGKGLALDIEDENGVDVWIYELERETLSRLTFDEGYDRFPVWTPDGQRVTFASDRHGGVPNIYWKRADGSGEIVRLTTSTNHQEPWSWSPDSRFLAFMEINPQTKRDIWMLPMEEDGAGGVKPGQPTVFLNTPFSEKAPTFSPDGRWLAYSSLESGRREVYVRPFPGPGGRWQISTGGGLFPTWSENGRELFYRTLDSRIKVVTYSVEGDSFRAGTPRLWSERQFTYREVFLNFDLHPDGKRFAVLKGAEDTAAQEVTHVNLILNWFEEVRRRVAAAGQN